MRWDVSTNRLALLSADVRGNNAVVEFQRSDGRLRVQKTIPAPSGCVGIDWAGQARVALATGRAAHDPGAIVLEDLSSGRSTTVAHGVLASCDPGGQKLAYLDRSLQLRVHDLRSGRDLVIISQPGLILPQSVAWSPDGGEIAFMLRPFDSLRREIAAAVLQGSGLARTKTVWRNRGDRPLSPGVGWFGRGQILFAADSATGAAILEVSSAGGVPREVARSPTAIQPIGAAMWLRDGVLADVSNRSATEYLMINLRTNRVRRVHFSEPDRVAAFAFSADGRWLACVGASGADVYLVNTATGVSSRTATS